MEDGTIHVGKASAMAAIQAQSWVETFSPREFEVLQLISNGLSNREIAEKLYLSIETVKWYNKQMFMKLGVKNRIQAVNKAVELDLLTKKQAPTSQEKPPLTGNLPAQLTSYVGRRKEINEIKDLLKKHRLVTLTGAGGSGKSRLAFKVGDELRDKYGDGVWLVELANIRDPSLVLQTIAKVLKITQRAGAHLDETLNRHLSQRHLLLIIDNLEHLLECASMIGDLLSTAPKLTVLGTSRERLHIYGEQEYPLHPLEIPDSITGSTREELENVESIALFIKRAQSVDPTFSLDGEALRDLARICVRLDGLPLAIELCAPMVKVFSLGEINKRIKRSLDAIPVGPLDLPTRQQTLRSAIQWGFDLLKENEKRLFIRMTVFNGGGTLDSVGAICKDGISGDIGNILSGLVNKNMILAQEREDGDVHFSMLETIRQFGREKLLDSGEAEYLADRHLSYFMKLAERGNIELCGPDQIIWLDRLGLMHDNMRTALAWVVESKDTEAALQFACNLEWFWLRHGDFKEGQMLFERVIALPDAKRYQDLYAQAFSDLMWLCYLQGKNELVKMAEEALSLARSQPNKHIEAVALLNFGLTLVFQEGQLDRGQMYMEEAKSICQDIHDDWQLARALVILGNTETLKKDHKAARTLFDESYNLYTKLGDIGFQGIVMHVIGNLEIEQNNLEEGVNAYRESLKNLRDLRVEGNLYVAANIVELARVESRTGNHARAVRLHLVGKKIYEEIGAWWGEDLSLLDETLAKARAELSELELQSAVQAGQHMTIEEAIEYALDDEMETKKIKTDSK